MAKQTVVFKAAYYNSTTLLTLSYRRPLSYRNQSTDLRSKSIDWFLYDIGLRHERVKSNKGLKISLASKMFFATLPFWNKCHDFWKSIGCLLYLKFPQQNAYNTDIFLLLRFSLTDTDDSKNSKGRVGGHFCSFCQFHPLTNIQTFICNFARETITIYFHSLRFTTLLNYYLSGWW